jgi:arylsulfatase A-like enzyme
MSYKRNILKTSIWTLPVFLMFSTEGLCQESNKPENKSPNVILILADDMAFGDLSRVNGGLTRTPNLDKLASESVWFNQGYSAAPVCAPARAALLTGLYPHQTGCITLDMQKFPDLTRIDKDLPTMADVFRGNGYATGLIGKWHCGEGEGYHPMDRGFDEFEGFLGFMVNTYFSYKLDINRNIQEFNNKYLTNELSERAIDFVRRHKDEPFFLHLAHYAPHRPLGAPQERIDYYLNKGLELNTATIYAMIEIMDQEVGKLIKELDNLGIRENTLIIFLSDNGPDPVTGTRDNQNLRGTKYTVYEGGIHVPFFMNWKGKLKPGSFDNVVHFTDVFPTLVEICNLELDKPINFVGGSLAELIQGNNESQLPETRFWQWNRGTPVYSHNAAVRKGDWKMVRPFITRGIPVDQSTQKPMLYNLKDDPFEKEDVSEQHNTIFLELNVLLEEWSRNVEYLRLKNKND